MDWEGLSRPATACRLAAANFGVDRLLTSPFPSLRPRPRAGGFSLHPRDRNRRAKNGTTATSRCGSPIVPAHPSSPPPRPPRWIDRSRSRGGEEAQRAGPAVGRAPHSHWASGQAEGGDTAPPPCAHPVHPDHGGSRPFAQAPAASLRPPCLRANDDPRDPPLARRTAHPHMVRPPAVGPDRRPARPGRSACTAPPPAPLPLAPSPPNRPTPWT
jgi:hypothetical protein